MATTTAAGMLRAPSCGVTVNGVSVRRVRSLVGCGDATGSRLGRRMLVAGATSVRQKAAPAVTQEAIDTMFQKDSAEQVQHPLDLPTLPVTAQL